MNNILIYIHPLYFWPIRISLNTNELIQDINNLYGLFEKVDYIEEDILKVDIKLIKNYTEYLLYEKESFVMKGDKAMILGYMGHFYYQPQFIRNNQLVFLHGSCLLSIERNGTAILFVSPKKSGKSTLISFLLANGLCRYFSDDIIPIYKNTSIVSSFPSAVYIRNSKVVSKLMNKNTSMYMTNTILNIKGEIKMVYTVNNLPIEKYATIEKIYIINRDDNYNEPIALEITASDALSALMRNLLDPNNIHAALSTILYLIKHVSIYNLYYGNDIEQLIGVERYVR